jgi:hypothetical protein
MDCPNKSQQFWPLSVSAFVHLARSGREGRRFNPDVPTKIYFFTQPRMKRSRFWPFSFRSRA